MGQMNRLHFFLEREGYTNTSYAKNPEELSKLVKELHDSGNDLIIYPNPNDWKFNSKNTLYEIYARNMKEPVTMEPFVRLGD